MVTKQLVTYIEGLEKRKPIFQKRTND